MMSQRSSLSELLNALQSKEKRRLIRHEGSVEDALQAKLHNYPRNKYKKIKGNKNYFKNSQVSAGNGCS